MRNLITELRRTIFSKGFVAGIAGTVIVLCIGAYMDFKQLVSGAGLQSGQHLKTLLVSLTSKGMNMVLPVLAALPCTNGFVEDLNNGYIKSYLPRTGQRNYIISKATNALLSGAFTILVGIVLTYLLFLLAFLHEETPAVPGTQSILGIVIEKSFMYALCGALWSLVGLALSTATVSTHMAYASPFILYYLLVILATRYLPGIDRINPQQWLTSSYTDSTALWGFILQIVVILLASVILFSITAQRRLKNV